MSFKKKSTTDEFIVASLAESSSEFAALIAKRQDLEQSYSKLNAERSNLLDEIKVAKAAGGERLSVGVARLLGEETEGSVTELAKRLRDVVAEMGVIEDTREVLRRRTDEARDKASKIICSATLPEYRRRLKALCDAARELEEARQHHDHLLDQLDVEDVNKNYLRPIQAHFMGDRGQGRVFHFLKEVRENGHDV
ncbi:hypothetical protein [Bradyrhizobium sp. 23]|uniref:hypothetical protein n=1 Tax=Bradyrhizobium sp. 23 TaxID=2782667 RepID=UPI001FF9BA5A|nr:hypothetical protein [Bradyrhizobium sp. 23]